jgi:hypothetical protein
MLEPGEEVAAIFRGTDLKGLPCWLVVSSERLICVPDRPAVRAPVDERQAKSFKLAELEGVRTRTRINRKSRLYFSIAGEGDFSFLLRSRTGASDLAAMIAEPTSAHAPAPSGPGPGH